MTFAELEAASSQFPLPWIVALSVAVLASLAFTHRRERPAANWAPHLTSILAVALLTASLWPLVQPGAREEAGLRLTEHLTDHGLQLDAPVTATGINDLIEHGQLLLHGTHDRKPVLVVLSRPDRPDLDPPVVSLAEPIVDDFTGQLAPHRNR